MGEKKRTSHGNGENLGCPRPKGPHFYVHSLDENPPVGFRNVDPTTAVHLSALLIGQKNSQNHQMISFPAIDAGSHPQQNKMVYCKHL